MVGQRLRAGYMVDVSDEALMVIESKETFPRLSRCRGRRIRET